jgi:hypothetical protein
MLQRDFIVRQVQQLTRVLAQVLFHKRADRADEAQEVLAEGLESVLGHGLATLRLLTREELLAACTTDGLFAGEMAVAVADLLREDDSAAGRERALWLYEAALASGAAVPFDIHTRIASLRTETTLSKPDSPCTE